MPRYSIDHYAGDIYVKTYVIDDDDVDSALVRAKEMVKDEQLLDIEEIDV